MVCTLCHYETIKQTVQMVHRRAGKLYFVENVEAEVCQECREHYYHAKTLDAVDKLLAGEYEIRQRLEVEVVSL